MKLKYIPKNIIQYFIALYKMYPRAKKYGVRYFFDKRFRKRCKNKEGVLRRRVRGYSSLLNKKKRIFAKNKRCCWCAGVFKGLNQATVDHIIPLSKGGTNDQRNLRLIHNDC